MGIFHRPESEAETRFFKSLFKRPEMKLTGASGYSPAEQAEYLMAASLTEAHLLKPLGRATFEEMEEGLARIAAKLKASEEIRLRLEERGTL